MLDRMRKVIQRNMVRQMSLVLLCLSWVLYPLAILAQLFATTSTSMKVQIMGTVVFNKRLS